MSSRELHPPILQKCLNRPSLPPTMSQPSHPLPAVLVSAPFPTARPHRDWRTRCWCPTRWATPL